MTDRLTKRIFINNQPSIFNSNGEIHVFSHSVLSSICRMSDRLTKRIFIKNFSRLSLMATEKFTLLPHLVLSDGRMDIQGVSRILVFLKCLFLPKYLSYLYKIKSDWQLITDHFMAY